MKLLARLWSFARALTGDSAYEAYARRAARCQAPPLSREAFYLDCLARRYSTTNRCC